MSRDGTTRLAPEADVSATVAHDRRGNRTWSWRAGALLIVIMPIVVAAIRAVRSAYRPVGDDGLLLVRVRDVGTANTPLLGSWTSASAFGDTDFNNPGGIYFDLVAPAVKLLGPWVGLVIGVMLVNAAAAAVSVLVAERIAGRTGLVAAAATVAALEWTLGSAVLIDIWQPNALVLPAFAYAVCLWALASGWRWSVPFVLGLGSLLVQTHIGYAYLVPIGGVGAIAIFVWQERSAPRSQEASWRRPAVASLVVLAVCWIQPVIEQLTADGEGNLSRLWAASQATDSSRLGPALAARLTAQVVARPPFWLRDSYLDSIPIAWGKSPVAVLAASPAAAVLLVLVGALVATGVLHHRRRDRVTATLDLLAAYIVAGAVVSLAATPRAFVVSPHQMRWLWAIGAFATMALLVGLGRLAPLPATGRRALLATTVGIAVLMALLNLPTYAPPTGPSIDDDARPVVARLDDELASLRGQGPVFVDLSTIEFIEPYSGPLFAILQDHDVPFQVGRGSMVRQLGDRRRFDGSARQRIWLTRGSKQPAPGSLPADVRRVALALGIDNGELRELKRLRAALATDATTLDEKDRQRAAELERRLARYTVAVYAGPTDRPPAKATESIIVGGTPSAGAAT